MDLRIKLERSLNNNWLETICLEHGDAKVDFALPPYHDSDAGKVREAKNVLFKAINTGVSIKHSEDMRPTAHNNSKGHLRMRHATTDPVPILVNDTLLYEKCRGAHTERDQDNRRSSTVSEWAFFNEGPEMRRTQTGESIGLNHRISGGIVSLSGSQDHDDETIIDSIEDFSRAISESESSTGYHNGYLGEVTTPGIARIVYLERVDYRMERVNGRDDANALFIVKCKFNVRTLSQEWEHLVPDLRGTATKRNRIENEIFLPIAQEMAIENIGINFDNQNLHDFTEELMRKQVCLPYMKQLQERLIEMTTVTDTIESCVVMNKRFAELFARLNYQNQGGNLQTSGYGSLKCGLYKDVQGNGNSRFVNMVSTVDLDGDTTNEENEGNTLPDAIVKRFFQKRISLDWNFGNSLNTHTISVERPVYRPHTTALNPYNGYRILFPPPNRGVGGAYRRQNNLNKVKQMPLSLSQFSDESRFTESNGYLDKLGNWEWSTRCAPRGIAYVRELVKPSLITQMQWYAQNTAIGTMPKQQSLFMKSHGFGDGGLDFAKEYYIKFQGIGENKRRPTFSESVAAMGVTQLLTKVGDKPRPYSILKKKAMELHFGDAGFDEIITQCPEINWTDEQPANVLGLSESTTIEEEVALDLSDPQVVPWMNGVIGWKRLGDGRAMSKKSRTLLGLVERNREKGDTLILNIPQDLSVQFRMSLTPITEGTAVQTVRLLQGRYELIIPVTGEDDQQQITSLEQYYSRMREALRANILWEITRVEYFVDDSAEDVTFDIARVGERITSYADEETDDSEFNVRFSRADRVIASFEEE